MAVELATGYISLVPSAKGLGRGIARELNGPLEQAGREAGDNASRQFGTRFSTGLKTAAKSAGIALGVAFGAAGTYGVKVAADFQQTRIAFEGILGSAEEANKRLSELQQFAAKTPFEFKGLADAAKNLLAVGFSADDIIPTMTTLGNVAATLGVGENEIQGVVRALGQMKGKGKASAEELQQISEQIPGFSAVQAIADDMGITVAEAFDRMQAGAIPADRAIKAILRGMQKFPGAAGAMDRQSKTLNGVLSTFKDTLNLALIQGIEPFLPAMSSALTQATPIIGKFIDVTINGIATVVTGFGNLIGSVRDFVSEVSRGDIGAGIAVELGKIVGLAEDHPLVSALATALEAVGTAGRVAADALSSAVGFVTGAVSASVDAAREAWKKYAAEGVGPVADAFESIDQFIGGVNDALAEQRDIVIPLSAAVATLAGGLVLYTQASQGLTAIVSAFEALGPVIGSAIAPLLASPVALIVIAVAAIGAAFAAAYLNIQPFRDAVDSFIDTAIEFGTSVVDAAKAIGQAALPVLQDFVDDVIGLGQTIADGIGAGFSALQGVIDRNIVRPLRPLGRFLTKDVGPAFESFGAFVQALFARIADVAGPAVKILRAQFLFLAGVLSDTVSPAFDFVSSVVKATFDVISEVIETIVAVLAPALGVAFDSAKAQIDIVWTTISSIIRAGFEVIRGVFDLLTGILTGDFAKAWQGLTEIMGAPFRAIRDIVVNAFEEISGFLGTIPARLEQLVFGAFGGLVDIATAAVTGISDVVSTTFEGILTFIGDLPGRISDLAGGMWDGIAEGFESVINFIIGAWNSLKFEVPGFDPPGPGPTFKGFKLGVPPIEPVDFANGGVVKARPGGLIGRLGEAGHDEAVVPLPSNFDISNLAGAPTAGPTLVVQQLPGEDQISAGMRALRWHEQKKQVLASR